MKFLGYIDFLNESEFSDPLKFKEYVLRTLAAPFTHDDYEVNASLEKGTVRVLANLDYMSGDSEYGVAGLKRPEITKMNEAVIKVTIDDKMLKTFLDPKAKIKADLLDMDFADLVKVEASILVSYDFPELEDFDWSNGDLEDFADTAAEIEFDPDDITSGVDELADYVKETVEGWFDELSGEGGLAGGSSLRKALDDYEKGLNESETTKPIKWKPSVNDHVEGYIKLSFPHRKTGLRVSGKTQEEWTKRLSKVLGGNVDLSYIKDFYPNHTLNFEFLHNDRGYRIYQSGESSSSASYVLQLYKPSATGRIKGAIAGLI